MNFELEACEYFLCETKTYSIEQQYQLLKKADTKIPKEVSVWKPFVHYSIKDLKNQITKYAEKIQQLSRIKNFYFV